MCHPVAIAPLLKAPWMICNPYEPTFINSGNSRSEFTQSSGNSSRSFQLVLDSSIESWINPIGFSVVSELCKLFRRSWADVWPKKFESKYLLHTLSFSLSQKQMIMSICSCCCVLFNDSSKDITYFTSPSFRLANILSWKYETNPCVIRYEHFVFPQLNFWGYLAVWKHHFKQSTCIWTAVHRVMWHHCFNSP